MVKPNPMGSTFAERAAAARGDDDFEAPDAEQAEVPVNTSFAERAGIEAKVVKGDDEDAESKTPPKKSAAKKS